MNKTLAIAKQECLTVIRRPGFYLTVVGLPLVAAVIVLVLNLTARPSAEAIAQVLQPKAPKAPQGYVDHAGVVTSIPAALQSSFVRFEDEATARAAASRGEIDGFLVVPATLYDQGEVIYYSRDFSPLNVDQRVGAFQYVVLANLAGSEELGALLWQPARIREVALEASQEADTSSMATFWLPYAVLMILFLSLSMASGWLLQSIAAEKDSRVIEILLSTVSAGQMLVGKTIGLGAVGLVQVGLWLVTTVGLISVGGSGLSIPQGFDFSVGTVIYGVIFFLLGYTLYAAMIAGLGALAPSLRDAGQVSFIIYLPMMIPLWLLSDIVNQPNGPLAVSLSLVPFTAPVVMLARMVRVTPPAWQIALSALLLAATAYGVMRLAARVFRAQTLLSGQGISLARLRTALRGD